jgi:hypothetical protein
MRICSVHNILVANECPQCRRDFRNVLGVSDLVIVRPPHVEDVYDIPGSQDLGCQAMTASASEGHSEVSCVRPLRHEGDCESLAGTLWDHDHDTGCCDA